MEQLFELTQFDSRRLFSHSLLKVYISSVLTENPFLISGPIGA